jgi:hypothetical protein
MLSGKTFKAACGCYKPVEFDCSSLKWGCERCIEFQIMLIDGKERQIKAMEKDKGDSVFDLELMKEHNKKRK